MTTRFRYLFYVFFGEGQLLFFRELAQKSHLKKKRKAPVLRLKSSTFCSPFLFGLATDIRLQFMQHGYYYNVDASFTSCFVFFFSACFREHIKMLLHTNPNPSSHIFFSVFCRDALYYSASPLPLCRAAKISGNKK